MEHEYKNKGYKLEEKDRDINWMLRSHTPVRAFASQTELDEAWQLCRFGLKSREMPKVGYPRV